MSEKQAENADRSIGRGQLNGDEPAVIECNCWNAHELAAYLRGRFAPNAPGWEGLEQKVAQLRANPGNH